MDSEEGYVLLANAMRAKMLAVSCDAKFAVAEQASKLHHDRHALRACAVSMNRLFMTTSKIQSLHQQLGHLNLLLDEARKKEKAAVLATIREQVKEYDIAEVELLRAAGFVKDTPKKLPAKYYDPSSGKSWSGRGACPKWLAGKNLDDYLIRPAAKPWWPGES